MQTLKGVAVLYLTGVPKVFHVDIVLPLTKEEITRDYVCQQCPIEQLERVGFELIGVSEVVESGGYIPIVSLSSKFKIAGVVPMWCFADVPEL